MRRLQTRSEMVHSRSAGALRVRLGCLTALSWPLCSGYVVHALTEVGFGEHVSVSGASSVESGSKAGRREFSCSPSCFLTFFQKGGVFLWKRRCSELHTCLHFSRTEALKRKSCSDDAPGCSFPGCCQRGPDTVA